MGSEAMTPRERLLRTLRGEETDRIPVYTQIPFALGPDGFEPGAFHGYSDADDWRRQDAAYWRLVGRMAAECDNFFIWRPPCMGAEQFLVSPSCVQDAPVVEQGGRIVRTRLCHAGDRVLQTVSATQPGTGHTWTLEHYCKSADDARALLAAPWQGEPVAMGDFERLQAQLGERGVMWVTVPSPILVVCRLFDPMEFLMLVRTEAELIHELLQAAAQRVRAHLVPLLAAGAGPVIRFGGAEYCTPPLMSPQDFDAFAVQYDRPLMQLAKDHGCFVAVHCHGRIRHALGRFRAMGVDQTDPVEQVPDGDLTLGEMREISGGRITLTGNVQMRELAALGPDEVRDRVRRIIEEAGPGRLIVTTTGAPLEPIPANVEANYNAMIDAVLDVRL